MSFTEWIFNSILPVSSSSSPSLHLEDTQDSSSHGISINDTNSQSSTNSVENNRDFHILTHNVRSVIQFRIVVNYFLQHQDSEEIVDTFFDSKVVQKTLDSTLKILSLPRHTNTAVDTLDERIVEVMKITINLVSSTREQMLLNQLFSSNTLTSFIKGLDLYAQQLQFVKTTLSESQEFHLLIKSICLRLDKHNLDLFISNSADSVLLTKIPPSIATDIINIVKEGRKSNRMELFDITCRLPPAQSNYHLRIVQRNVVLIMARLLVDRISNHDPKEDAAFESTCIFMDQAMFQQPERLLASSDYDLDGFIDDLLYFSDIIDIFSRHNPLIIDYFYQKLPAHSSLHLAISIDVVHHYNESLIELFLARIMVFDDRPTLLDVFCQVSAIRSMILHCSNQSLLKQLNILPSKSLHKLSIMSDLLDIQIPSSASFVAGQSGDASSLSSSPPTPTSIHMPLRHASKRSMSQTINLKTLPPQSSLSDLGPLDPSRPSTSDNAVPELGQEVNEDPLKLPKIKEELLKIETASDIPIPRKKSRDLGLMGHRKRFSEQSEIGSKIYEVETIQMIIENCIWRIPSPDQQQSEESPLLLVQFACLQCVNDLLNNYMNLKLTNILNEQQKSMIKPSETDLETAKILMEELDNQYPLIKDYKRLPFSEFAVKHRKHLREMQAIPLLIGEKREAGDNLHSILRDIFV